MFPLEGLTQPLFALFSSPFSRRDVEQYRNPGDMEETQHHEPDKPEDEVDQQKVKLEMLSVLEDLEETMDPLVAARVYNTRYSPIYRLSNELLLDILEYIGKDLVTTYCLRRVSRRFFHLIGEPTTWGFM
jgi:hypothetical protein